MSRLRLWTCLGLSQWSSVRKNFFLDCSVGRLNLVLRRLRLPSLLQKTSFELLRSGLRLWLRSTSRRRLKHYTRLWRKFPMKRGDYSWATLLLVHPRLSSPEPRFGSLDFRIRSGVSGPNQILSSTSCRGVGSDISLSQRPSSHKCPTESSIVRKLSNAIALWSTPTPTSASESRRGWFGPASAIHSDWILLESFRSQSSLSDPWLWGNLTNVPSRSWSSIRRTSLDSSLMSRILMPSVSVCETLFRVDYESW